jgi:hypothetical protein
MWLAGATSALRSRAQALGGPLAAVGGLRGSASLDDLADGLCIDVSYVTFAVGAPEFAGELVQAGPRAGAGGGFKELIGEHGSPFRDPPD